MKISSLDIEEKNFSRKMRGYDPDEVDAFLRALADELQRLNLEREQLRGELGKFRAELEDLRGRERTLQSALAAAERISEQMREQAQREAEEMLAEARLRSERMIEHAQSELAGLEREVTRMRIDRDTFENRLRLILDEHRRLLDLRDDRPEADDAGNLRRFPPSSARNAED